jgi:hypothetical protein
MVVCPACNRRVLTHREILAASLDGAAKCPGCGQLARLDSLSRCLVGCVLALLLWMLLLQGNLFYSGYLFVFSTIVVLAGWRLLSAATLPLLSLEKLPTCTCFNRKQSLVTLAIVIVTAIAIDVLLSYRSHADKLHANAVPPTVNTTVD